MKPHFRRPSDRQLDAGRRFAFGAVPRYVDDQPAIATIQKAVAEHFGISMVELLSDRRGRGVARARQVAMFLCTELTGRSLPVIGRCFNRDHTTVMHAMSVVPEMAEQDRAFRAQVAALRATLEGCDV